MSVLAYTGKERIASTAANYISVSTWVVRCGLKYEHGGFHSRPREKDTYTG